MNARKYFLAFAAAALLGTAGYGLYRAGVDQGMKKPRPADAAAAAAAGATDSANGRKVLYWHDPMVPGQKFDHPGKSPFMDMPLVPVYADGDGAESAVAISAQVRQNLGVRTADVAVGTLAPPLQTVGSVAYDERQVAVVQARSAGFVEKLHVRAPLDPVRKGELLAELYVPDWVAAQEEFLSARRLTGTGLEALVDGARQRMRLAGMNEAQIRLVEDTGSVHPRLGIAAPIGGVVTELGAREGMTVMAGATLFRINGLETVWVNAEVPENLAAQVRPGNRVRARTPALPGIDFTGKVSAILPEVNLVTRTLKARLELANPGARLVPGMFATIDFTPAARDVLLVPTEAVIQTGRRSVVVVARENGRFAPVDVETGVEANGRTEIRKGLQAGQKVVVSGQFLIDSEANLKSTLARLEGPRDEMPARAQPAAKASSHTGTGTVESIDAGAGRITVAHDAIASLDWPAMTMEFAVRDGTPLAGVKPGQRIEFELTETAGEYVASRIVVKP